MNKTTSHHKSLSLRSVGTSSSDKELSLKRDNGKPLDVPKTVEASSRNRIRSPRLPLEVGHASDNNGQLPAVPKRSTHRRRHRCVVMVGGAPAAPNVRIDYSGKEIEVTLWLDDLPLLSGLWTAHVTIDGRSLGCVGGWESQAWTSNKNADYIEWRRDLPVGRQERGLLLARTDRFALLTDAVILSDQANIGLENRLGLPEGIRLRPAPENTEAMLCRTKGPPGRRGSVGQLLPLALGEWRTPALPGDLLSESGEVVWRHAGQGCALLLSLWIDLDRQRIGKRLTWRQLTVGEALRPVSADKAVGYRVAIANRQWLIYRALDGGANRTLLGHNLSTELLVARFDRDGEVQPLVEIE